MTASAQIGTLREVPDSASTSLPSGGESIKSDFQSVFEQYHASREGASKTNDRQGTTQQKQKAPEPTTTPAVTQPVAPAEDAPRLIFPFTTSLALRQEVTSPDDATTQDATSSLDDAATKDSTAWILTGTLDLRSLPWLSDAKSNSAAGAKSKDSVPSQTAAAPLASTASADPSIPIHPITSAITLEQGVTVLENSSTVSEATYSVSTSTSDRTISYQYGPSNERQKETTVSNRAGQEQQKNSDPTEAVALPMPVTNALEPQPPISPLTSSNTPRQNERVLDGGSAALQDSSAAAAADLTVAIPPALEHAVDDTAAAPNSGGLAFAVRLTPSPEMQPTVSESNRPVEPMSGSKTPLQFTIPVTAKQIATGVDLPADAHNGDGGGQSNKEKASELFAKPEALLPQMHAAVADQTAIPANNHASVSPLPPSARTDQVIDPPATPPNTSHDITVRIPDSTDQGTAVRFVERAGEIHVSVRTGDAEMAQNLRGGLNDLVNHLEDGGIRTEVWQPGTGSNAASSQNDSHQPFADPDGSNGRQHSSGSHSEQDARQQNKPRWVEVLEGSIGKSSFKETTQLPWQA